MFLIEIDEAFGAAYRREQLEYVVERVLTDEVSRLFEFAPHMSHLIENNQELNEQYYCRHRIETIARIRLTSRLDALALVSMINEDYDAARWWSTYTAEELGHDRLFFKDLKEHGYSEEIILNTPPFKATLAMVNYIENEIARSGALPAVAYSICAEWNCERVSATVVTKAEKQFSPGHVRGSKAHIGIDSKEDHYKIMLDVAHRLLLRNGSEKILIELLVKIMGFFGSYFSELHEASKRAL